MNSTLKLRITLTLFVCSGFFANAQAGQLVNVSTRVFCKTGDAVLVTEFILQGTGKETVVLRGLGPFLADFGVPDPLEDPVTSLLNARGRTLDTNDNWMDNPDADRIVAAGLEPTDPLESAMIDPLRHGTYTFVEQGTHRGQGVALPEIYDLSDGGLQLSAVGTRGLVSTEDNVMISGFIIADSSPISLLIRALGPSLADAGLHRVLPDPLLELRDGDGNVIFSNDNWRDTQEAEIEATGLAPTDDLESALVVDLFPGIYTAVFSGVDETTGLGFLQFYSLDLPIRELNPAPIIRRHH